MEKYNNPVVDNYQDGQRYTHKRAVRKLFIDGGRYTASDINRIIGTNDARKLISTLRKEGFNLKDEVTENRKKIYWLDQSVNQEGGKA